MSNVLLTITISICSFTSAHAQSQELFRPYQQTDRRDDRIQSPERSRRPLDARTRGQAVKKAVEVTLYYEDRAVQW